MARTQGSINNSVLLQAALEGLELQRTRLDEQISLIRAKLGIRGAGRPSKAVSVALDSDEDAGSAPKKARKRRKRQLSEEARQRIAEAQKRRWANYRKENS